MTGRTFCLAKLCGLAQMRELFSAEHRTLSLLPMAFFHILVLLDDPHHWSLGEIAKRMPTEPELEKNYLIDLKLFVFLFVRSTVQV